MPSAQSACGREDAGWVLEVGRLGGFLPESPGDHVFGDVTAGGRGYPEAAGIGSVERLLLQQGALLDRAPATIFILDDERRVTYWNRGAEACYGWTREEALGRVGYQLLRTEFPDRLAVEADLERDGHWDGELVKYTKGGDRLVIATRLSGGYGADGRANPILVIDTDVTARHVAEKTVAEQAEQLRATNVELVRASAVKSSFLATMSHEIRTPMNAVIGMTSLLLDTEMEPRQRDYVETVRASGEHLLAIINDILDYTKIDAGKLVLEELPFDVRDWLSDTLDLITAQADEKDLELAYDVAPDVPGVVLGDPGRLRQVVVNLLSNAVKFTAHGEVVVRVALQEQVETGTAWLRVVVTDTGIGIAADHIEALFEPFTQADSATARDYGGTGLGLTISRQLAERMGGRLTLASKPGAGTAATFTFPARTAQAAIPAAIPAATPAVSSLRSLAGHRLLIVDDNRSNRRILQSWATRHQMNAVAVEGPAQALRLVDGDPHFTFAVLDLMMPAMDGAQLGELLKARLPATHLILLSSAGPHRHEIAARGTFAAVLSKPARQEELFNLLATLLRTGRATEPGAPPTVSVFDLPTNTRPLSILVVEDNPVNQKVAQHLLARFGHPADVAAGGEEALDCLENRPYDLILMDVQMPGMDGLEATRRIRARWPGRPIQIVAMTANVAPEDARRCHEAGMDGFLSKPVAVDTLADLLRALATTPPTPTPLSEPVGPVLPDPMPVDTPPLDPEIIARLCE